MQASVFVPQPMKSLTATLSGRSGRLFLRAVPRTFPIRESDVKTSKQAKSRTAKHHHLDRRADMIIAQGNMLDGADDLLTTAQLATWLGVSVQFLEIGRSRGNYGPPHVLIAPRVIRYRRDEVNKWLRERSTVSVAARRVKLGT